MNSNDYFLANKCGYSACCNVIEDPNYVYLGGFIFVTRSCDAHKEMLMRFLLASNRAIKQDQVCQDIITELDNQVKETLDGMVKAADELMPYEDSEIKQNNDKTKNKKSKDKEIEQENKPE